MQRSSSTPGTEELQFRTMSYTSRLQVDPSVTSIPASAFHSRKKLNEVELCEGLVEIGEGSFAGCGHSITKDAKVFVYTGDGGAAIPEDVVHVQVDPSVTSIPASAFHSRKKLNEVELWKLGKVPLPAAAIRSIRLHDGIESIGRGAFAACIFTNFRVPPLITSISKGVLTNCSMISVKIQNSTQCICNCHFLQNVAFPPNAVISYNIFFDNPYSRSDLKELFGSETDIIRELKH